MTEQYSETVETAREYYNSDDADNFYSTIWGGEDIHIGLYQESDSIYKASRRTVKRMASRVSDFNESKRVLDMGAGYSGSARFLADKFGCEVMALNLSEVENERARTLNREHNLDELIQVVDGNFEEVPEEKDAFDVVWSQDSFLHSGRRKQILEEAYRVLTRGGDLVFTDPMQADDCPEDVLQPILDRIHLESLGSPGFYRDVAREIGFQEVTFEDHTQQLVKHYSKVLEETKLHEFELEQNVSQDYIEHMKEGLKHWVDGGKKGYLAWGIFHCKHP